MILTCLKPWNAKLLNKALHDLALILSNFLCTFLPLVHCTAATLLSVLFLDSTSGLQLALPSARHAISPYLPISFRYLLTCCLLKEVFLDNPMWCGPPHPVTITLTCFIFLIDLKLFEMIPLCCGSPSNKMRYESRILAIFVHHCICSTQSSAQSRCSNIGQVKEEISENGAVLGDLACLTAFSFPRTMVVRELRLCHICFWKCWILFSEKHTHKQNFAYIS